MASYILAAGGLICTILGRVVKSDKLTMAGAMWMILAVVIAGAER